MVLVVVNRRALGISMSFNRADSCLSPGPTVEKKAAQPGQRAYMNKSIRPWPEAALGNKPLNRPPTPKPSSSEALHSRHTILSSSLSSPSSSRSPNVSSLPATMPEKNPASAGAAAAGHPTAPHRMALPHLARLPMEWCHRGGCEWRTLAS